MVIALFYTEALHGLPLAIAAGLSVVLLIMNRMRVMHLGIYLCWEHCYGWRCLNQVFMPRLQV